MNGWLTDSTTSQRFPVYTRANADEIGPAPFPPLTWTLAWERGAVPGTVDAWVHLGAFRREEFRESAPEVYGCWGGYLYNQVSVGRVFGVRAPGGSPDAVDRTYFGSHSHVPRYEPDPRDRDDDRGAAIEATLAAALAAPRVDYAEDFVAEARQRSAALRPVDRASDQELISEARSACDQLRRAWDVYIQVVISASVGPATTHAIAERLGRPELGVAVFTALGGVESAEMNHEIWQLSRDVARSPELTAQFDGRTDDLWTQIGQSTHPDDAGFRRRLTDFLARYGHRSGGEYDLASQTWSMSPDTVLVMVNRIRRQDGAYAPEERALDGARSRHAATAELEALAGDDTETLTTLRTAIASGQRFYRLRESCKDALVRTINEVRAPVVELGRRLAERGSIRRPGHIFAALDSELDDLVSDDVSGEPGWDELLEVRAGQFAELGRRRPPEIVMHGAPIPPIDSWPLRDAAPGPGVDTGRSCLLTGIGASPGVSSGPARIALDLGHVEQIEPNEVLVCRVTDPSWTPFMMAAAAVVCEVGAEGSHAAIVSRELGIPCVMSVRGLLDAVRSGQIIEVDGSAGTVTLRRDPACAPCLSR